MSVDDVRQALLNWVRATLAEASQADIAYRDRYIWIDAEGGGRTRVPSPSPVWSHEFNDRSFAGLQWKDLQRAARSWCRLSEHVDVLIGAPEVGAATFQLRDIAARFLPKPTYDESAKVFSVPRFDLLTFESEFSKFKDAVDAEELRVHTRVILIGLDLAEESYPYELFANAWLDKLSLEEVQELGELGIMPSVIRGSDLYDWDGTPRFILRWNRPLIKRFGSENMAPPNPGAVDELQIVLESLMMALSLVKSGEVSIGTTVTQRADWSAGTGYSFAEIPRRYDRSRDLRLSAEECVVLRDVFLRLQNEPSTKTRRLGVALRRLMYGMERKRPEDRFLDDMIAAEALFGDANAKSEVGYRLALRAAFALQPDDPVMRRSIFQVFRDAYGVRSTIAHGATPKDKDLTVDGKRVALSTYVDRVEEYIRMAVRMAVLDFSGSFLPDNWDDRIIGPAPAITGL